MSASANSQRAATGWENDRFWSPRGVIGAGVSTGGTFRLMQGSQAESWT